MSMRTSFSEANLPKLPGLNVYVPKRTTWGRKKYFDVGADGVMLEAKKRPTSSPGRAHRIMSNSRSLASTRATSSRLRPLSATDMRSSGSLANLMETQGTEAGLAESYSGDTNTLRATLQKKEKTLSALRQLAPLTVNQKRVALQTQLAQLELDERNLLKENLPPGAARSRLRSSASTSTIALNQPPKWVKHDREVLRFYLYFKESVPESAFETERVRRCTLYYYLADDTCKLSEPKVRNSGIAGGDMLKRAVFLKPDGKTPYAPIDFLIGAHVVFASKNFRVIDADANTRAYFMKNFNIDMGPAEAFPEDTFVTDQKVRNALDPKVSRRITNEGKCCCILSINIPARPSRFW